MERLQKIIANSGYCSRRKAEEYIKKGQVFVNGELVTTLGIKVTEKDQIIINGQLITKEQKEYYLLYKPRGVITSTKDDKKRKTVIDLIPTNRRIYPVGRLDYDTSGILLLTNDGDLTQALLHPSNQIDKVYIAKVNNLISPKDLKILSNGVNIDGRKTAKGKAKLKKYDKKTNTSIVELTIHEGRNHQVKKMFETLGYKVIKLKRERIGFLDLSGLKSGEYRSLTPKEIKILYNDVVKKVGTNKK